MPKDNIIGAEPPTSIWTDTAELPRFKPLRDAVEADVCVVGAGLTGLTAAYLLGKAGRRVVVLEAGPVAAGNTRRTTAHLSNELDDRYSEMIRIHGVDVARLTYESHTSAIAQIEAICGEEGIDCDFERVDGYLFLGPDQDARLLEEELRAVREIGWTAVEQAPRVPVEGFASGPCLRFPGQAQFHPLRYVQGLCRAIAASGGQIYTRSHVEAIAGGAATSVATGDGGLVRASATIVATGSPVCDTVAIHTKQAPYTTYVVGLRVEAGRIPHALFWDTLDPYHYVRLQTVQGADGRAQEVLIVGGEDHKTGQADDGERRFAALERWARERFPGLQDVAYRWSGMVFETLDGAAYIGPDPGGMENVYIATGDSGMGMTHGTLAGMLLRDQVCGVENAWSAVYDPRRKPIRAAGEFIRENANVARQYTHLLGPGEVRSLGEIGRGAGAVIRRGLHRVAVYRDHEGQLHACAATCPHLKGPLAWNSTEGTWDCQCHGSRFDPSGRVLSGPALHDLERIDPGTL